MVVQHAVLLCAAAHVDVDDNVLSMPAAHQDSYTPNRQLALSLCVARGVSYNNNGCH